MLDNLLEKMQKAALQKEFDRIKIYEGMKVEDYKWVSFQSHHRRPLSTVVLDPESKINRQMDIEDFLLPETRRWYREHSIPYRRGYLFHGPPGTGKSSLCFAFASVFSLDVYTLSLNGNIGESGLSILFKDLPNRCILLWEDIDTTGVQKRRGGLNEKQTRSADDDENTNSKTGPISLSALLNVLDGVGAREGCILIMTTNHKDKLDHALLRPGRVDMEITFNYANMSVCQDIFLAFYAPISSCTSDTCLTSENIPCTGKKDEITELSIKFAKHVPSGEITPAEIQNYLLRHRNDPAAAVAGVSEWIENRQGNS